jgi:3-hydroxyacyl-CoA dehydrogenase
VKAGIIGGGVIGAGWARLLDAHGHEVRIYDERPPLCRGAASIAEAAAGAELVIEAVAERADVKREVLTAAGVAAPADALIASASSSILPIRSCRVAFA